MNSMLSKVVDDSNLAIKMDLNSNKILSFVEKKGFFKKADHQISMVSLHNQILSGKSEQKTIINGALTERTNHTDQACSKSTFCHPIKQFLPSSFQSKQNPRGDSCSQILNAHTSANLYRFAFIVRTLSKLIPSIMKRFLVHLSKTSTADKYLRLIYSIFKLYRALYEQNNLGRISKEILTTRRILQWETKYELLKELKKSEIRLVDFSYKIFQLLGNLFDFTSLWMHMLAGKNKLIDQISQIIYSWQDDCYFYQCVIELILSVKNFVKNLTIYQSQNFLEKKKFQILHVKASLTEAKDQLQKKYNRMRQVSYLYENSSYQIREILLAKILEKVNQKQGQIKKIQDFYETWETNEKQKVKKQIIKSSIKILKYICDVRTSYNNYSWKSYALEPVNGGILSIFSSILSISLIWNF